jgi:hypothetical protein
VFEHIAVHQLCSRHGACASVRDHSLLDVGLVPKCITMVVVHDTEGRLDEMGAFM